MEILGLIIIVLIWFVKAMAEREDGEAGANKDADGIGRSVLDALPVSEAVRAGLHRARGDGSRAREREGAENAGAKRPSPTEVRGLHKRRRADEWESSEKRRAAERANSQRRWADAREKQSDAALVHGVHIDSCEGRLESLKVLYDAGILDREEYVQRVGRVKARHAQR